jgi:predicted exporter
VAAALVVAWRAHYVADLSAFLPSAPTPEQAVLLDQLKSGATSRLLVIGIEGGAPDDEASAAARAEASKRVAGGAARERCVRVGPQRRELGLGRRRPLPLRPPLCDQPRRRWRALQRGRAARCDRCDRLAARHAGRLAAQADPLSRPDRRDAAHRRSADAGRGAEDRSWRLGLAPGAARGCWWPTTAADGADIDGQQRALAAIRSAFDAAPTPGLRLVVSGAGKFSVESRERIKSEVERLALFGSVVIVVLLWLAFASGARSRSPCCRSRPAWSPESRPSAWASARSTA